LVSAGNDSQERHGAVTNEILDRDAPEERVEVDIAPRDSRQVVRVGAHEAIVPFHEVCPGSAMVVVHCSLTMMARLLELPGVT
jgi:hypothetical protein